MNNLQIRNQSGYAVLEVLFYILLFGFLSTVTINSLIVMTQGFRDTAINRELAQGATILESISRDVRQANTINGITNTSLEVENSWDSKSFVLNGDDIEFSENGVLIGDLNPETLSVENLSFAEVTSSKGQAVRITLTVSSENDPENKQKTFYNTVGLRGSY